MRAVHASERIAAAAAPAAIFVVTRSLNEIDRSTHGVLVHEAAHRRGGHRVRGGARGRPLSVGDSTERRALELPTPQRRTRQACSRRREVEQGLPPRKAWTCGGRPS